MFKLTPDPTFTAPVDIHVPGQADPARVEIEFRRLTRTGIAALMQSIPGREDGDVIAEIVAGWSGVDAPFSAQALATLVDNYPAAALAIYETFLSENGEARRKN